MEKEIMINKIKKKLMQMDALELIDFLNDNGYATIDLYEDANCLAEDFGII